MFKIRKAARSQAKMRIGLFGPSGSGKTYSALLLAKGLVGSLDKVVVIDTENNSADLYSHLGNYSVLPLLAPYEPRRYVEAIKYCEKEGYEVIITDSITHEWDGPGGCLDIHSKLGGKFETWAKVTPLHQRFIEAIVSSSCHIIATGRSKTDYAFEGKKDGGKGKVEKVGLKTITREGFDYELTVAFQINHDHYCTIDKDRTDTFRDCSPFMVTEETGRTIREWNEKGEALPPKIPEEVDVLASEKNDLFKKLKALTDNYNNKYSLDSYLLRMGVSDSRAILCCNDLNAIRDWSACLDEPLEEVL